MTTRNAISPTTLSSLIHESYDDTIGLKAMLHHKSEEPVLVILDVRELPRLMHDPAVPLDRQDEVLAAAIRCYRRYPDPLWTAVLLEMLSPMLVAAGSRFAFVPDGVSREVADLPRHLPVLVQAYADPVDVPWVALHAGRVLGVTGRRMTPKHRRPLREVYRLAPSTRLALQFYVEDGVLDGVWLHRRSVIAELDLLGFDLVLAPNVSVWRSDPRFAQLTAIRMAFVLYHELLEAGLPAIPDIGFSRFEPDGRLWAEWINCEEGLRAVSIFCGGRRIHAERRAHRETVEDIALLHREVRPEVAFVLGGVHAPERLADYRRAAPRRRLSVCNGMAYALAQRRRLLDASAGRGVARSARECFLLNCAHNDRLYARLLGEETGDAVQVR